MRVWCEFDASLMRVWCMKTPKAPPFDLPVRIMAGHGWIQKTVLRFALTFFGNQFKWWVCAYEYAQYEFVASLSRVWCEFDAKHPIKLESLFDFILNVNYSKGFRERGALRVCNGPVDGVPVDWSARVCCEFDASLMRVWGEKRPVSIF